MCLNLNFIVACCRISLVLLNLDYLYLLVTYWACYIGLFGSVCIIISMIITHDNFTSLFLVLAIKKMFNIFTNKTQKNRKKPRNVRQWGFYTERYKHSFHARFHVQMADNLGLQKPRVSLRLSPRLRRISMVTSAQRLLSATDLAHLSSYPWRHIPRVRPGLLPSCTWRHCQMMNSTVEGDSLFLTKLLGSFLIYLIYICQILILTDWHIITLSHKIYYLELWKFSWRVPVWCRCAIRLGLKQSKTKG
jgi:hypothetical protein